MFRVLFFQNQRDSPIGKKVDLFCKAVDCSTKRKKGKPKKNIPKNKNKTRKTKGKKNKEGKINIT
jgi:hypothetical protein